MSAKIRKVKVLRGKAKEHAKKLGLNPNDLVIVIGPDYIEKIEGDPVSYLLKRAINSNCKMPDCGDDCYYDFKLHRYICKCGLYEDVGGETCRKLIRKEKKE